jgi:predicted lipid carrier protein YhbT
VVKVASLLGSVTYLLLLSGGPEDAPILWLGRRLRLRGA